MAGKYTFKRRFYYDAEHTVRNSSVTFILGAQRCGKTVCMKQLYDQFSSERDFDKVLYTDIKKDYNDKYEKISFINQVIASINKVSNKKLSQIHFDALPGSYRKILLTKDRWEERDGVAFVPYYQFIFENSVGRELFDSSLNNK